MPDSDASLDRRRLIGRKLWRYRHDAGLSQEKLAELTGFSVRSISGWEAGDHSPYVHNLDGLIVALALNPAQAAELHDLVQRVALAAPEREAASARTSADHLGGLIDGLNGLPDSLVTALQEFLNACMSLPEPGEEAGQADADRLERWLVSTGSPYGVLVGQSLSGALVRWAVRVAADGRAAVAFVPISHRLQTVRVSTALDLLEARLRHLRQLSGHEDGGAEPANHIEGYLCEDWPAVRPLLVVLDAVDEAEGWTCAQDLRLPARPGLGVKVLVSTRRLETLEDSAWQRLDQLFDDEETVWRGHDESSKAPVTSVLVGQLNVKDSRVVMIQGDNLGTIHMGDEVRPASPAE